jgi:hypothetical protein
MTKWLNAFLEFKNEDSATKKVGLLAFLIITASLALLSVSGAIASSQGGGFHWIIRAAFATLIFAAETLAAVIFVRAVMASKTAKGFWPWLWAQRKAIVCLVIWIGLSWTCVQNAKIGAHVIFPDRFEKSSTQLAAEATVAGSDATTIETVKTKAIEEAPKELERVRTQIADLKVFQTKMSAMTREGIMEAQSEMIPRCNYEGRVDGIRSVLTEAAMRRCGEKIGGQLAILETREADLSAGQLAPPPTSTSEGVGAAIDPRIKKAELEAAADKAWWDAFKLELMLWVLEIARSMGLWAAFTSTAAADLDRARQRLEELAEAEHQRKLAELQTPAAPPTPAPAPESPPMSPPAPVEAVSEPEPPTPPPELELTEAQRWGREGAKQAQLNRKAEDARQSRLLIIGPVSTLDALKVAAE